MKSIIGVIVIIVIGIILYSMRNRSTQEQSNKIDSPKNAYLDLRNQILGSTRETVGIPKNENNPVWGVLMEFAPSNANATVVALADGNASIYLSTGGGFIGGFGHESVKQAAIRTVTTALQYKTKMQKVTSCPLATTGNIIFYLLTDEGIYSGSDSEKNMTEQKSNYFLLYVACQDVITQYRLIEQKK